MTDTKVNVGTPGHIDHETKDSGMPDIIYACILGSIQQWTKNIAHGEKYYSESYMQSRIAEAEERQRVRCAKAFDAEYGDHSGENEYYECMKAILNAGGQDDE